MKNFKNILALIAVASAASCTSTSTAATGTVDKDKTTAYKTAVEALIGTDTTSGTYAAIATAAAKWEDLVGNLSEIADLSIADNDLSTATKNSAIMKGFGAGADNVVAYTLTMAGDDQTFAITEANKAVSTLRTEALASIAAAGDDKATTLANINQLTAGLRGTIAWATFDGTLVADPNLIAEPAEGAVNYDLRQAGKAYVAAKKALDTTKNTAYTTAKTALTTALGN